MKPFIIFMPELNGYQLTKNWFKFCASGTRVVKPIHSAFYFYCIHLCNQLKWKVNFGLPTDQTMEILGIKNKETYYNTLNDLVEFGFIKIVQKSINQYTANIICLPKKPVGTPVGTVPIVKRYKTIKTLVNEEQKTVLTNLFQKVRADVPRETLEHEAGKFLNKYPNKDMVKDINLINAWAVKITFEKQDKISDFEKTLAKNKEKYGTQ